MKILVDGSLPQSLSEKPNSEGVVVDRFTGATDDAALLEYASSHGYAALVVSEPEMLAQETFHALARDRSISLVYSVTDDPVEVETNLRHALRALVERIAADPGASFRISKSGVHSADPAAPHGVVPPQPLRAKPS